MTAKPSRSPNQTDDPAPRFAVGELVMVRSTIDPARNTDCTRVIDREWFEGEAEWGWYRGWQYVVTRHVDAWAVERSLRPRPEPAADSWNLLKRRLGGPIEPRRKRDTPISASGRAADAGR